MSDGFNNAYRNHALVQEAIERQKRAERNRGSLTQRRMGRAAGGTIQPVVLGGGGGGGFPIRLEKTTGNAGDAQVGCDYQYTVYDARQDPNDDPDPIGVGMDPTEDPHEWVRWDVGAYKPADAGIGTYAVGGEFKILWINEIQEVEACETDGGYVPGGGDGGEGTDLPPVPGGGGDGETNFTSFDCGSPLDLGTASDGFALTLGVNTLSAAVDQYIATNRGTGAGAGFRLRIEGGAIKFQVDNGSTSIELTSAPIQADKDYSLDVRFDNLTGLAVLAVNGVFTSDTDAALIGSNLNANAWNLGRAPDSNNRYFSGSWGNLRAYNSSQPGPESLRHHWPMDEGLGTVLNDIVSDCDGVAEGDPWWGEPVPPTPEPDPCQQGCQVQIALESNVYWGQTAEQYDPLTGDWSVAFTCQQDTTDQPSGSLLSVGGAAAILTSAGNVLSWNGGGYTGKSSYTSGEVVSFTGTSNRPNSADPGGCGIWGFNMTGSSTGMPFDFTAVSC